MNPQRSLFQKLILPAMILIMMLTGFLVFKKNPEIMSQRTLLSLLKKHAEENKLEFQTPDNQVDYLQTPSPTMDLPHLMTVRLLQNLSVPAASRESDKTDRFSSFLQGPIILAHDHSTILAISTETGQLLWKFLAPSTNRFTNGRLAVMGTEVVAATENGGLYAFQISTGKLLWYWQASETLARMPLVYKNSLLLFRQTAQPHAQWALEVFDPIHRTVKTKVTTFAAPLASTPVVSDHLLVLATQDQHLEAINLQTKKVKWTTEGSSDFTCPPKVIDNRIFICNDDGYVLAYDLKNGRHAGDINVGSAIESPLAITKNLSIGVAVAHSGDLIAFDLRQRKRLWRYSLGTVDTHLRVAETLLTYESRKLLNFKSTIGGWTAWAGCHISKVCIFDLKTGQLLARLDPKFTLAGNLLLVHTNEVWVPVYNHSQIEFQRWVKPVDQKPK